MATSTIKAISNYGDSNWITINQYAKYKIRSGVAFVNLSLTGLSLSTNATVVCPLPSEIKPKDNTNNLAMSITPMSGSSAITIYVRPQNNDIIAFANPATSYADGVISYPI